MLTKQFFLDQHGCAKNQVDGELLIGILNGKGWRRTDDAHYAKLIIVNSCGFIEPAKKESLQAVISARQAYPHAKILLAGCLAERYADELKEGLPEADAFFGNGDLTQLPKVLDSLFPNKTEVLDKVNEPPVLVPEQHGVCCGARPEILNFPRAAFIKITEGCDNWCTFCAIPIIRGSLRSRPIHEIVAECKRFIEQGFYEFNLVGQDLAAFTADETQPLSGLAQLLNALSSLLKGHFRVRLLYIHPDHFPLDILPVMISDPRFLPYFDIPFQSGSTKIIHSMNRKGSSEQYLALVKTIREAFEKAKSPYKRIALRTTFLEGFPGETDENFAETTRFLKELKSLWSGSFEFSKEEGTKAATLKGRIKKEIVKGRIKILQGIQAQLTEAILQEFLNEKLEVLVEEVIPSEEISDTDSLRLALGRAWFQAPEVDGSVVLNFNNLQKDLNGREISSGSIVLAKIIAVHGFDIEAVVL